MRVGYYWIGLVALAFITAFIVVTIDSAWADANKANGKLLAAAIITGLGAAGCLVGLVIGKTK